MQRRADLHRGSLPVALAIGLLAASAIVAPLALAPLAYAQPEPAPGLEAPLDDAEAAYEGARWAAAGRAFEDALASGGLSTDEWVRAHTCLARICLEGQQAAAARHHLTWALAVQPALEAPHDWPAEARALLAELRDARHTLEPGQRQLGASLTVGGPDAPIRVTVHGAPEGLVQTVIVSGGGGLVRTLAYAGEPLVLRLPADGAPWFVRALDASGNVLTTAGVPPTSLPESASRTPEAPDAPSLPSPQELAAAATAAPEPGEPDLVENPWLWVVVGLLAVGIGVVVGLTAFEERTALGAPVLR